MLDSELHDTESSNDGPGSNSSAGLSDTPAATAAPRARTTRRRTAKSAAEPAPETKAAAQAATAAGPAAAAPAPGGDQAEDAAPKRPARRTRRSTAKTATSAGESGGSAAQAPAPDRAGSGPAATSSAATSSAPATTSSAPPAPAGTRPAAAGPGAAVTPPFAAPFTSPTPATGQAPGAAAQAEPAGVPVATFQPPQVIFQPPAADQPAPAKPAAAKSAAAKPAAAKPAAGKPAAAKSAAAGPAKDQAADDDQAEPAEGETDGTGRRRRRRSRSRGKGGDGEAGQDTAADGAETGEEAAASGDAAATARKGAAAGGQDAGTAESDDEESSGGTRRRRRKRRRGSVGDADQAPDDPPNTVVHVRPGRSGGDDSGDEVQVVRGSTRLEAKRQRRREGRDSGRRRPPVITESEFLARREAVDRVMVVRQRGDRTQIAVLEDKVLVEHYVDRGSHQSLVGNVYRGKVQNVLPSMEAAFVDIGKGRNAVLYAGEVNFDASGLEGEAKRIELALKSGQSVLVQVTKDPVGHKGARLTSQASLPGRYLVYVPGGSMMGISRKLPDTERTRLKQILKQVMPENAGVIVRTAAEGASEEELAHDVARLSAQWETIERKAKSASPPELLYSEPDLTIRVIRDIFNEDFSKLVVSGDEGWDLVDEYVRYVAPHLADRLEHWQTDADVFAQYRIDEHLVKALERKVWLPSGGSLVIDNTEAMTVVDVNTGKFTGQGGNLEETVTRNNLEAAEEIVRQLRLRDVGGIIVIDFIDMVLESNRELVLRRLLECLARDRTKHQVAEVTSLGLVQMTRKRVGSGLLEAFSETCECCNGRGLLIALDGVDHPNHRGRQDGGAAKDSKQARDGKQGKDGRRQRQGKDGKAADKPAASTAPAADASTAPAAGASAGTTDAGTGATGTADAGTTDSGNADAPAATGPAGANEAAGNGAGADAATAQPFGGRRRRRAAVREPGPPDMAAAAGGQAAPDASTAAGV